jgi:hypothetical protein
MSGFVPGLRAELVAAAARRERRRLRLPSLRVVVPVAVAAAAVAAAIVVLEPQRDAERPAGRPPSDVRPLFGGTLEAGVRYGSVALVPAVSFAVGDDRWLAQVTESADALVLRREAGRDAAGGVAPSRGYVMIGRPREVYDPGSGRLVPPPADVVGWLRAHPDIDAGRPRAAQLAGLDAQVLDLTFRFSKPVHEAPACVPLQGTRCTELSPGEWHLDGAVQRLYVVESDPGPLLVSVEGFDRAAFADIEQAARPILRSLAVTRP